MINLSTNEIEDICFQLKNINSLSYLKIIDILYKLDLILSLAKDLKTVDYETEIINILFFWVNKSFKDYIKTPRNYSFDISSWNDVKLLGNTFQSNFIDTNGIINELEEILDDSDVDFMTFVHNLKILLIKIHAELKLNDLIDHINKYSTKYIHETINKLELNSMFINIFESVLTKHDSDKITLDPNNYVIKSDLCNNELCNNNDHDVNIYKRYYDDFNDQEYKNNYQNYLQDFEKKIKLFEFNNKLNQILNKHMFHFMLSKQLLKKQNEENLCKIQTDFFMKLYGKQHYKLLKKVHKSLVHKIHDYVFVGSSESSDTESDEETVIDFVTEEPLQSSDSLKQQASLEQELIIQKYLEQELIKQEPFGQDSFKQESFKQESIKNQRSSLRSSPELRKLMEKEDAKGRYVVEVVSRSNTPEDKYCLVEEYRFHTADDARIFIKNKGIKNYRMYDIVMKMREDAGIPELEPSELPPRPPRIPKKPTNNIENIDDII